MWVKDEATFFRGGKLFERPSGESFERWWQVRGGKTTQSIAGREVSVARERGV